MFRKLLVGAAGSLALGLLSAVPAMAYTGGAGATATVSTATPPPGGMVTFNATFTNPSTGAGILGESVSFSFTGGGTGCTVGFNPASATTDASGSVSTVATLGASCSGVLDLVATDANGTVISASVTVTPAGGLPNASAEKPASSLPMLPLILLVVGSIIALAAGSTLILRRRSS